MRTLDTIAASGSRAVLAGHISVRSARPSGAGAVAWLAPDIALSAAMATLLYLVVFFGAPMALFRDADAGWHIRAGERMLAAGALPHTDPFSFSRPGAPWIAWEWGADVLAGAVHGSAGLGGVAFLYSLAIGASVWMWFRLNWAVDGNFGLACFLAAPMLSTASLHWLARPHIFSWLFLLGAVWFCERMPRRLRAGHLAGVAALSCIWANVHGSFLLGPAIASIYAAGTWVSPYVWGESRRDAKDYLYVAAAALAGSLVNPNGWQLHRHVIAYLADSALLDRIGEFQSFNFHADGSAQIAAALILGLGGGFAALSARRAERFLLALVLTAGALRSARMLPVAALLLLPLANGSITGALAGAKVVPQLRSALDGFLDYGAALRNHDRKMRGYALVPLVALALFFAIRVSRAGFPADQFPVSASPAVAALPADARIFAPDKFGGYLIYRFEGARKVFFDGRSDFYGADFLRTYSRMVQVRPGWREAFEKWKFTHALLPTDYSLVPALEALGWTELYRDRTAVLLKQPMFTANVTGGPGA